MSDYPPSVTNVGELDMFKAIVLTFFLMMMSLTSLMVNGSCQRLNKLVYYGRVKMNKCCYSDNQYQLWSKKAH